MSEEEYFEQFAANTHLTYRVRIESRSNSSESNEFESLEEAYREIENIKQSNTYPYKFIIVQYSDGIEYKRSQVD